MDLHKEVELKKSLYSQRAPVVNKKAPTAEQQHANRMLADINKSREKGLFSDVILHGADNESGLRVHKIVLAAFCPFFEKMFTISKEKLEDNVKFQDVNPLALELLIDYIYTGKLSITEANVRILLLAARVLELTEIYDVCSKFLQNHLDLSNCMSIRSWAETNGLEDFQDHADNCIAENFTELTEKIEFLASSLEDVVEFIESDRLMVPEEKIFECVMSWVKTNLEVRQNHLIELMEHVRLPLISSDYLNQHVAKEILIKKNEKCRKMVAEAIKYNSMSLEQREKNKIPNLKPRNSRKVLVIIGALLLKPLCIIEYYDFINEKWYTGFTESTIERHCGELAVIDGKIYAVGGHDGWISTLNKVDVFDPSTNEWTVCAKMTSPRSYFGIAVLDNLIYAVGGFNGTSSLDSAEVYDPQTNKWQLISKLSSKRTEVGVGVLNGLLYAVGGFDGGPAQKLSSVECYNPVDNSWKTVADMSCPRSGPAVGVLDGVLYAFGGKDLTHVLKSGEAYHPDTDNWRPIADMEVARSNARVVTFDGKLYVVGGNDGSIRIDSIEVYSPKNNSWRTLSTIISTLNAPVGIAIVDKPRSQTEPERISQMHQLFQNPEHDGIYGQIIPGSGRFPICESKMTGKK